MIKNTKFLILFSTLSIIHGQNNFAMNQNLEINNSTQQLHTIYAGNYYYQPSQLSIMVGDTVRFMNNGGYHDVEVTAGPEILSLGACNGPCTIGDLIFNTAGDYDYICSIGSHASLGMVGTISVLNNNSPFQPQTKEELQTAVDLWVDNHNSALSTYGDINTWDVSLITDMADLFKDSDFNSDISNWDVSNVTTMDAMFRNTNFNQDLNSWDVSSVTNMSRLLYGSPFNRPLNNWDVSNVTTMVGTFQYCNSFNQDISNWNTSSITRLRETFKGANSFDQDLSNWDVSNVSDWHETFSAFNGSSNPIPGLSDENKCAIHNSWSQQNGGWPYDWTGFCTVFKPQTKEELQTAVNLWIDNNDLALSTYGEINTWDVSLITNMSELFLNKSTFNGDISNWDVSNVTNLHRTFEGATLFNSDISGWNVSNVTDMRSTFSNASSFNQPLDDWDVSSVTQMPSLFVKATSFNQSLNSWDVSNVVNMGAMFSEATSFNHPLSNWDVSNVTNMAAMFSGNFATEDDMAFDQDISSWNVSSVTTFQYMFVHNPAFNSDLSSWNVSNASNFSYMFGFTNFNQDVSSWDLSNATTLQSMFESNPNFNQDLSNWDVSNVTNISGLFAHATAFESDLSGWNISNVTNISGAFKYAAAFESDLSNWDISNVTVMAYLFAGTNFSPNIASWDVSNITDMERMFRNTTVFNEDISDWDVSSVTNMSLMFLNATGFNQDISDWDVSNVTNMYLMFKDATEFNQDISDWDVSNVINMTDIFANASALSDENKCKINLGWSSNSNWPYSDWPNDCYQFTSKEELQTAVDLWVDDNASAIATYGEINTWDVSLITNMSGLFKEKDSFNSNISAWDVSNVTDMSGMFMSASSFNQDLSSWNVSNVMSMSGTFQDAFNFTSDLSNWDVSNVTSMGRMFVRAFSFESDLSNWDVSSVVDMHRFFDEASSFDSDLSNWNVSNVITMHGTFMNATNFTSDLSNWDVSNVTDIHRMFSGASNFNQDLSLWDVSSVTNMAFMFNSATSFNQDLSNWDVSNVTKFEGMFLNAVLFNQDISSWNVSSAQDMSNTFNNASSFNGNISSWNVSNVNTMEGMFQGATSFNQDLSNWNVSNVENMALLFFGASEFNGDLNAWDVSNVTNMYAMFKNSNFSGDISSWDVSNVTDMSRMFSHLDLFNSDISRWDVSSVTNMREMFYIASAFDQDLSSWNVSSVSNMNVMFFGTESLSDINKCSIDSYWSYNNVWPYEWSDLCYQFATKEELQTAVDLWTDDKPSALETYGEINTWDVSLITDMANLFGNKSTFDSDISNWDVSNVINMSNMFLNAHNFNQDLDSWDVSNVQNMGGMFSWAHAFNQDLNSWDISNVNYVVYMFHRAYSFNGDISNWNISNVTNLNYIFWEARSFNGDLSSWDVSNVTSMAVMFGNADSLNQNFSSWDVSNVTNMVSMFYGADEFNGDISTWNVSNVTDMRTMFWGASSFNRDLSNWDVSNVTTMKNIFFNTPSFNQDLSNWDISNITDMDGIFGGNTGLSATNQCIIHEAWSYNAAWPYNWECLNIAHVENHYMILEDYKLVVDLHIETVFDSLFLTLHVDSPAVSGSFEDSLLTLIPDENWHGETMVMVTAADTSYDYTDTVQFHFVVEPVNDAPVVESDSTIVLAEDGSAEFVMFGFDVDDDDLEYEIVRYPSYGEYDGITFTPYSNYFGYDTLSYVAIDTSDAESELAIVSFIIESLDDEPYIENYLDHVMLMEDFPEPLTFDLDTVFTDIDGPLTYRAELIDSSVVAVEVVESILSFYAIPNANGITELILTASNPTRASVADTIMVSVDAINDSPSIVVRDTSMIEDGHLAIKIHATDVDGDSLEYIDVHFEPEVVDGYFFGGDSLMIHSIVENWNGIVNVHLEVSDGYLVKYTQFALGVLPVNDAPYFMNQMHATVGIGVNFHLMLQPMDIDSETIELSFSEETENPAWVILEIDELNRYILHGIPDSLGYYPIYLALTDGETTVLDTFYFHVVNFRPEIVSIEDIPNDQGGEVYVRFNRSFLDNGMETNQLYGIYRLDNIESEEGWVLVQSGPAIGSEFYYFQVPTLHDSSVHGDGMTQFKVVASMNNGIFSSDYAMGYSIDNIVPMVPTGMLAASVDNYISLSWDESLDEDFQYFELLRSGGSVDDIVVELIETMYEDYNIEAGVEYSYKLAAYDYNGNFSGYSEPVLISMLSAEDDRQVPIEYSLNQNYPNPFNPTTQINYELPNNTFVIIDIYDVMGHRIKSLINSNQEAGYKSIQWDATNNLGKQVPAGMYIYTIQAGDFRKTRKMVLLK